MNINTASTVSGALLPGYTYADLETNPLVKDLFIAKVPNTHYLANFWLLYPEVLLVLGSSVSETGDPDQLFIFKPDPNDPGDPNKFTLSTWSWSDPSADKPGEATFTMEAGAGFELGSKLTLLANVDGDDFVGVYVPVVNSELVISTPAYNLNTVTGDDVSITYVSDHKVLNEDTANTGSRLFPTFEAGNANIASGYGGSEGSDQLALESSLSNFQGGKITVKLTTDGTTALPSTSASMIALGVSTRSMAFGTTTVNGVTSILYYPSALISGTNVPYTPDANYWPSSAGSNSSGAVSPGLGNDTVDSSYSNTLPGVYLWERGDPLGRPSSSSVTIGTLTWTDAIYRSGLSIELNSNATPSIVEALLSHISVSVVSRTGISATIAPDYTQNWDNLPSTVNATFTLKTSATAAAATFTRVVDVQSVAEPDNPSVDLVRSYRVLDEIVSNNGTLVAINFGQGSNVYLPALNGNQGLINDVNNDWSGGTLRVSFLQGANDWMRLGISNFSGVFTIDWNNGRKITYYESATYYGQDTVVGGANIKVNEPKQSDATGTVIGFIDQMEWGWHGGDLLIHFNDKATTSIIQTLLGSVYMAVNDPTSNVQTNNWKVAAGDKLLQVTVTDAAGHSSFDTRPMRVISSSSNDSDVMGSDANEQLIATSQTGQSIAGLGGKDDIIGGNGNDTLLGGSGNDSLTGGSGRDVLDGEGGEDTYDLTEGARARDTVKITPREQDDTVIGFDTSNSSTDNTLSTNDVLKMASSHVVEDTLGIVSGITYGVFSKHTIVNGMFTLMDRLGRIQVISDSTIRDVLSYLNLNLGQNTGIFGFTYDTDSDGKADSVIVFEYLAPNDFSAVQLQGLRGDLSVGVQPGIGVIQLVDGFGPTLTGFSITADKLTLDFNEAVASADLSGIQLQRFKGTTKVGAVGFTTSLSGSHVDLVFTKSIGWSDLGDDEYLALVPIDRSKLYVTDAAGNAQVLLQSTDPGVVFTTSGNSTIDITNSQGNFSVYDLSGGNDALAGNRQNNKIDGGIGNDSIIGRDGNDTLLGGLGDDSIWGGADRDWIDGGAGNDSMVGDSGNDTLKASLGSDTLDGGSDLDRADYSEFTSSNWKLDRLANGDIQLTRLDTGEVDLLRNIEELSFRDGLKKVSINTYVAQQANWSNSITGTDMSDTINTASLLADRNSPSLRDWVNAGAGDDTILAAEGGDDLRGEAGNDLIDGGPSQWLTMLTGGPQTNTWELQNRAYYSGPSNRYAITQLNDVDGSVTGTSNQVYYTVKDLRSGSPDGTDTVFNIDALQFSDREVRLTANVWNNYWNPQLNQQDTVASGHNVDGTAYSEQLGATDNTLTLLFEGSDRLNGGAGDDTLKGGAGADTLRGDKGNDQLDGGANREGTNNYGDPNGFNGADVAEFSGNLENYTITRANNHGGTGYTFTVSDVRGSGGDGVDTLQNIEVLRFADQQVNLELVKSVQNVWASVDGRWQPTQEVSGINWEGSGFEDTISSGNVDDYRDNVRAGAGNDLIQTGKNGDWIDGGEGDDTIDGGANGTSGNSWQDADEVHYEASIKRFIITQSGDQFIVRDKLDPALGGYGEDTLTNIERISFSGGTSMNLRVDFNPNAWSNNVNGTDFNDVVDTDALRDVAFNANAQSTLTVRASNSSSLLVFRPELPVLDGQRFIMKMGWINNGEFTAQYAQSAVLVASGGLLTSVDSINRFPTGGNNGFQLFEADANDQATGDVLIQKLLQVVSDRSWIQTGKGDDVVYAHEGGDYILDGLGNDFYDGGANGNSVYEWENQDRVQFSGSNIRYKIEVLTYNELSPDIQALVDASSSERPQSIVRVTDRIPAVAGGDGVNYLINIEQIGFDNMSVDLGVRASAWTPSAADLNSGNGDNIQIQRNGYNGGLLDDLIDASVHDTASPSQPVNGVYSNHDHLDGGAGNDTLIGGLGSDYFVGGTGDDLIDGGGNANYGANGGDGGDEARFIGKFSSFVIDLFRLARVDELSDPTVHKFNDKGLALSGESQDAAFVKSAMYDPEGFIVVQDLLVDAQSGQGRDVLRGIERLSFDDLSINLSPYHRVWPQTDANGTVSYESWDGSPFGDLITSGSGFAQSNLSGYGGHDSLVGGLGRDFLQGGAGNDTLDGGGNPAVIDGNTWQSYDAAQYDAPRSQFEILQLHDQEGTYYQVRHLVPDDLGGLGVDTLKNIERIDFNNSQVKLLVDTNSRNMGPDDLNYYGTMFADTIDAGFGDDWINPGQGHDTIDGGSGVDGVTYSDAVERYQITLVKSVSNERFIFNTLTHFGQAIYEEGDLVIVKDLLPVAYGGEGEDVLSHVEVIAFSNFQLDLSNPGYPNALNQISDTVSGTNGDDSFNDGSDRSGEDVLLGLDGNDRLDGGADNDILDGGAHTTDLNNWWNSGDIANYGSAPRGRFDVIALSGGNFTVIDYASILELTTEDFGADGHLLEAVYTNADRVSKTVGYGVDTLVNIEHLDFQDVRLSLINQINTWGNGQYTDPQGGVHDLLQSNISGTFLNDLIVGTDHRDWIEGGAGNDTIDGGDNDPSMGNDWRNLDEVRYQGSISRYVITPTWVRIADNTYTQVSQGEATDVGVVRGLVIEDRFDAVIGGVGKDLVVNMEQISFGNGERIVLSPETYSWHDSYTQSDNLNINGTQFNDVLGSALNGGNDYLRGNSGDDLLMGGAGGDELIGGLGNDTLIGGDNAAPDLNGWIRTDNARYEAPFSRFEISNITIDGKIWLQVKDKLPATATEYLGVDLLEGVESLAFNDRWIDVAVRTNSWSDMQGYTTLNFEGTVFDDLIDGASSSMSISSSDMLRYSMRGNGGNDVLVGGNLGDDFQGGEGLDLIDGGGNGTSGDSWRDQDIARFSGDLTRYDRFNVSISRADEAHGTLWVDQVKVADIDGNNLSFTSGALNSDVKSVLRMAASNMNLLDGRHDVAVLVQDKIDSAYGGDGADLIFNVETLQFRDTSIDSAVTVQTYDWNNDGELDWVNVRGTNADDLVDMAQLVALSGKDAEQLSGGNMQLELREGNDSYLGGVGGSNILTGKGHDYVDGGTSTAKDSWGNDSRDEVRFEGNFSRYVLIDVLLRKADGIWTVSSSKDPSLNYQIVNGQGVVSSESSIINKLDKAGIALGLDRLVELHPDASTLSAWMVADRLPVELEGTGVDVLSRVDAISFNDRWIPLSLQVWLNRSWSPDLMNLPYEERPVVGSGVEGTTLSEQIGVDFGNVDGYNFGGDDWIRAGAGDDTIMAGDGGDGIQGDAGNDLIDGGNNGIDDWGNVRGDSVNYEASFDTYTVRSNDNGSVTVTDSRADGTGTDTLRNIEYISFQDRWIRLSVDRWVGRDIKNVVTQVGFNGSLVGDLIDASQDEFSSVQHNIQGNEGNDTLIGGDGPDQLEGGQGDDRIIGGSNGKDSWGNPGLDTARFQGSINRFVIEYSNDGKNWSSTKPASGDLMVRVSDKIASDDGGLGIDTVSGVEALSFSDAYITLQTARNLVDLNGDGRPDAMQVIGTAGNDLLVGDYTNDQLIGNLGNDTLEGGQGADILKGGQGDDTLDGGANGVDGSGNSAPDVAEFAGKWSDYSITSISGGRIQVEAKSTGDAKADGTDTLDGIEALQFSDLYVRLQASSTPSDTNGDGIADLYTLVGTDLDTPDQLAPSIDDASDARYVIVGGLGNDELTGGSADDVLVGGAGNDLLTGNAGTDRARYTGKFADYVISYSDDGVNWLPGNTFNPDGWVKVTHNASAEFNDGVDVLSGIEELVFSDKLLHLGQSQVLSKSVDANGDGTADTVYWTGTLGDDLINGDASLTNQMNGDAGNDTLKGGSGADIFRPGSGNDEIWSGTNQSQAVHDQVVIEGKRTDYKVSNQQVHTVSLHDLVAGQTVSLTIGGETFTRVVTSNDSTATVAQALAQAALAEFKINASPVSTSAGATLKVDTNAGVANIEKGMHLKFSDGSVFQILSTSSQDKTGGGKSWTLELDSSFAKAPTESVTVLRAGEDFAASASDGTITIKTSNALFSVQGDRAIFNITTSRYTEVLAKTGGELDKLYGIDELVFDDLQLNLLPTSVTSLSIVGGRPQTVLKVTGTDMADFMVSTHANEVFTGGLGSDQFVIASGNGKDVLRDFMAGVGGDVLSVTLNDAELSGLNGAGISDVDGLLARGIQQGSDVVFNLGVNNAITLIGVAKADLVGANFEFVHGH